MSEWYWRQMREIELAASEKRLWDALRLAEASFTSLGVLAAAAAREHSVDEIPAVWIAARVYAALGDDHGLERLSRRFRRDRILGPISSRAVSTYAPHLEASREIRELLAAEPGRLQSSLASALQVRLIDVRLLLEDMCALGIVTREKQGESWALYSTDAWGAGRS